MSARLVTSINGQIVPLSKARISSLDNSLLYAEGLFETFLAIGDTAAFVKEHLQRLRKGAKVIGIKLPVGESTLKQWMTEVLCAHPARIKRLRLTVTSGESAVWSGRKGAPQILLAARQFAIPEFPYKLHISEFRVDQESLFRRIKTISYAINAAALKNAHSAGCDDALLLITSANIFWVRNNRLYTPPLNAGCLEGITRRVILREAKKLGSVIAEKNCRLSDLADADEVFISSSLKLVAPVGLIKSREFTARYQPGPYCMTLRKRLFAMLGV
jgi:branched-subunit amino acid aminotransferase/4-amino-4-deoxychorismate lyase